MQGVNHLFEKFAKTRVLVLGDLMLDHYLSGKVDRISPEAPVPVVAVSDEYHRLGGAGNVALNLKAMGLNPVLCAFAGEDLSANMLKKVLQNEGISHNHLLYSTKRPTTVKTRILSKNQQLIRVDKEWSKDLEPEEEAMLLIKLEKLFEAEKPQILIFQDYDKGLLTARIIEFATDLAKKQGTLVAVDPKFRHFFDFKNADLFKPNLNELRMAFSLETLEADTLEDQVHVLQKQYGHKNIMVTLSEKGIYWHNGKEGKRFSAKIRNIADVSGAGDTVIALAALGLFHDMSVAEICQVSNMAGGIVCESPGVVPIDLVKLADEWQRND